MSLGAAFALAPEQAEALLALPDDAQREEWLEGLEEAVEDADWLQYDKDWDELHRCLGDGELKIQDGPPRAHAVFGSRPLMEDDDAPTFAGFLPADELPAVTAALREVDRDWLRARYDRLGETDYGQPLDDEVFEAVWTTLQEFRDFYARLAERGAAVVFTVTD